VWPKLHSASFAFNTEFPVGVKAISASFTTRFISMADSPFMARRQSLPPTFPTVASEYLWHPQYGFTTASKTVHQSSFLTEAAMLEKTLRWFPRSGVGITIGRSCGHAARERRVCVPTRERGNDQQLNSMAVRAGVRGNQMKLYFRNALYNQDPERFQEIHSS